MGTTDEEFRAEAPRVLRVELSSGGGVPRATVQHGGYSGPDPGWGLAWRLGTGGLAATLLFEARDRAPSPLVVAAGDAVRRGLPTAARATIASRSPLTGRLAEGQVGGELGPRLAAVADGLVVGGRLEAPQAPTVLVVDGSGAVELVAIDALRGASPADAARIVQQRLGPCALLRPGPAGLAEVPYASLAAGGGEPSFVGRGGLGAALGALGLAGIAITAEPAAGAHDDRALDLLRALGRSPRLAVRAGTGTAELWHALAVRGELVADLDGRRLQPADGAKLVAEARAAGTARHGCRGCPTPCGWTFERRGGGGQRAHFGAAQALGPALGFEHLDDSLRLLAACDAVGLDAKEMGACLALWVRAGRAPRGAVVALEALVFETAARTGAGATLALGSRVVAEELGLSHELSLAGGQAVREGVSSPAVLLGQTVSSGGSDPMRSFTFLADEASPARVAELVGAAEPAPGALVAWHENLVAAVDAVGFCAFSTAGLLADGVCDLDELADWILPHAWPIEPGPPGRRLLAGGAAIVLARRQLDRVWSPGERAAAPLPSDPLERPELLGAYRAARGLAPDGRPTDAAWSAVGTLDLAAAVQRAVDEEPVSPSAPQVSAEAPHGTAADGRVVLRAVGPLGDAIGGRVELRLDLPATAGAVLEALLRLRPGARSFVGDPGAPLAGLWRAGARLGSEALVRADDELDLVLVIAGG